MGNGKKQKKAAKKQVQQQAEVRMVVGQQQQHHLARQMPPGNVPFRAAVPIAQPPRRPQSLNIVPMQAMYVQTHSSAPPSLPSHSQMNSPMGTPKGHGSPTLHYRQNSSVQPPSAQLGIRGGVKVMLDVDSQQMLRRQSQNAASDQAVEVLNELDRELLKYEISDVDYPPEDHGRNQWRQQPVAAAERPPRSPVRSAVPLRYREAEPPPDYDDDAPVSPPYQNGNRYSSNGVGRQGSMSSNDSTPNSSVRGPYLRPPVNPYDQELKAKLERRSQQLPESSGQYGRGLTPQEPIKKTHFTMANAKNVALIVNEEFAHKQRGPDSPGPSVAYSNGSPSAGQQNGKACWGKNCRDPEHCYCQHRQLGSSESFRQPVRTEKVRNKVVVSPRTSFWQTWIKRKFDYIRENIGSAFSNIYFWRNSIHDIEGYYGTGVAAVFFFLQWLMLLNILMLILVVIFIVVPQSLNINSPMLNHTADSSDHPVATIACPSNATLNQTAKMFSEFQDLLQGTGWMEWTEMFYGFYIYNLTEAAREATEAMYSYNLSVAYLLVTMFNFGICLILMLRSAAKGTRENLFTSTAKVNQFCNAVFISWDFCIRRKRTAAIRTEMLHNELKSLVEEVNLEEKKKCRSKREKYSIMVRRIFVNVVVITILTVCGILIFFVVKGAQTVVGDGTPTKNNLLTLLIEFSPSITVTVLNVVIPLIFEYLAKFEKFVSPATVISMTMVRTVFLRLSAIAVLLGTLYTGIHGSDPGCLHCWETYVGQQIYKLAVMDFVFGVFIPFVIHFPRKLIVTYFPNKFTKWIGLQPFDIPTHTLDIVYCQALCWMGTFYCPLLPVLTVIKCLAFFYVKKFSLFVNCEQSRVTFRVSKSSNLFIIVLILSYILAIIPVAFSIGRLPPSGDCGPFMGLKYMWDIIDLSMEDWPNTSQSFVRFFGTAGFAIPALISLLLLIYYYVTVAAAHKHELHLLQEQLVIEGRDKQFLLKRLQNVMDLLKVQSASSHLAAS